MTSRLTASLCVANRSEYARVCLPIRALSAGRVARLGAGPTLSTDCQERDYLPAGETTSAPDSARVPRCGALPPRSGSAGARCAARRFPDRRAPPAGLGRAPDRGARRTDRNRRPPDREAGRPRIRGGLLLRRPSGGGGASPLDREPEAAKPTRLSPRGNLAVWSFEVGARRQRRPAPRRAESEEAGLDPARPGRAGPPRARPRRAGSARIGARGVRRPGSRAPSGRSSGRSPNPRGSPGSGTPIRTRSSGGRGFLPRNVREASPKRKSADSHRAAEAVLTGWAERRSCSGSAGAGSPPGVTAFREGMAVHGRFGEPCPECGAPVQRGAAGGERGQLLRALPDRRTAARRPGDVAPAPAQVAADAQGSPKNAGAAWGGRPPESAPPPAERGGATVDE